jgi:hypothetical protein
MAQWTVLTLKYYNRRTISLVETSRHPSWANIPSTMKIQHVIIRIDSQGVQENQVPTLTMRVRSKTCSTRDSIRALTC